MEEHAGNRVATYKVTTGVLGVQALLGWGPYDYTVGFSENQKEALREQTANPQNELNQLNAEYRRGTAEYDQLRQSAGDLKSVQGRMASAQEQVKGLKQTQAQLTKSIAQARARLTPLLDPSDDERVSQTGTARQTMGPLGAVNASQKTLTKLGCGPLTPDGRMGQKKT